MSKLTDPGVEDGYRNIGPNTEVGAVILGDVATSITTTQGNPSPYANALRKTVEVSHDSPNRVRVRSVDGDGLVGVFTGKYEASDVTLPVAPQTGRAIMGAVSRALQDDNLSTKEANQLNNLRAFIANHSGDGVLDAKEQNIIIQGANNIASARGK